ncbi:hypothetical protein BH23PLA1_BH23PLA1_31390 [soil metagenome]
MMDQPGLPSFEIRPLKQTYRSLLTRWIPLLWITTACMMSCEQTSILPTPGLPVEPRVVEPLPELVLLEPGTVVVDGVVSGWTHPIIRSVPRLGSGELKSLPASAREAATLFRTVITADVVATRGGPRLSRVGVGNAIPHEGGEVVIRTEGPASVLEGLGFFGHFVLGVVESRVDQGRLIARTPTFALFRTPTVMVVDGRHEETELHYAFLVEPDSGGLTVLSWASLAEEASAWETEIIEIPRNSTFDLALDVRVTRRIGPIPTAWSFAMSEMPPGRSMGTPAELELELEEGEPDILERTLRQWVRSRRQGKLSHPPRP